MYKLQINKDFITEQVKPPVAVIRTTDGACIPFDPDNTDYQAFLKYQSEGGVVLPADDNEQAA